MNVEYYLPKKILSNMELEKVFPQYAGNKIYLKTGIEERHISAEDELISDMGKSAVLKLFEKDITLKEKVDFIILCTQSPDYQLPATACILQEKLGLSVNVGALDVNLGCSGFVYCLALAKGLLISGISKNLILVMSEAYSKGINELDSSTRTIFGDAACAIHLTAEDAEKIGEFCFGTDGSGSENLIIPSSGEMRKQVKNSKEIMQDKSGVRTSENLYMNGPEIFDFTLERIPPLIQDTLVKNDVILDEIKLVIPHQANRFMLEELSEIAELPMEKVYIDIADVGNTVCASIPIALKRALDKGMLLKGDKVLLIGFGVGYSWAGVVMTIT